MTDSHSIPPTDGEKEKETQIPEVPSTPELPEPPDVHFERPVLPSSGTPGSMRSVRTMSLAFSAGISLIAPIVIGALGGNWLDRKFSTTPWLTLVLLLLGVVAGFTQMIRVLQRIEREEKKP
jgi:ATP synthase protein I